MLTPIARSLIVSSAAIVSGIAAAQPGVGDIEAAFSRGERSVDFAQSIAGLVTVREGVEFGVTAYDLDDSDSTEIVLLALQASRTFRLFGEDAPGLLVEGSASYARSEGDLEDLFFGLAPGSEASVDYEFRTLTAQVGVGPAFETAEGLTLTPMMNVGGSLVESDADYAGPGTVVATAVADGIAFNWEAGALSLGFVGRAEYVTELDEGLELRLLGRYDVRLVETVGEDDPAQDFSGTLQFFTLGADVTGGTETEVLGGTLGWQAGLAYTVFAEGDAFGSDHYVQLSGGVGLNDDLNLGSRLALNAVVVLGEDLTGIGGSVELAF
ncbi:MAG: hypothetical protein AAGH71_02705 [Planctomycetota bacterium]